jgi:hypothetical protein
MDKANWSQIAEDRIKALEGSNFQAFCDRLLLKLFPNDYTAVRAGGNKGDLSNDGYCPKSRTFYAAHATRGEKGAKIKEKLKNDLVGCLEKQHDVKRWIFLTNDTLIGSIAKYVDDLRREFEGVEIETWNIATIVEKLLGLNEADVEHILQIRLSEAVGIRLDQAPRDGGSIQNFIFPNREKEQTDWGVIKEIVDFIIDHKIDRTTLIRHHLADDQLTPLQQKIDLNFPPEQRERVKSMINNSWHYKSLAQKFLEAKAEVDSDAVMALTEKIQSDYCIIRAAEDAHTEISSIKVLESLANEYIDPTKKLNPTYAMAAKAIILSFFELCDIGKKSGLEPK